MGIQRPEAGELKLEHEELDVWERHERQQQHADEQYAVEPVVSNGSPASGGASSCL
jgi:hypothetical protein